MKQIKWLSRTNQGEELPDKYRTKLTIWNRWNNQTNTDHCCPLKRGNTQSVSVFGLQILKISDEILQILRKSTDFTIYKVKSVKILMKSRDFLGFKSKILKIAKCQKLQNNNRMWNGLRPYQSYNLHKIKIPTDSNESIVIYICNTPLGHQIYMKHRSKTIYNKKHWGVRIKWFVIITNYIPQSKLWYTTELMPMTNPVTPCLGPWLVWNPLDQAASVILIQATPGWFSGHMAHLGSHICINANDDTHCSSSSFVQWPFTWHGLLGQEI